MNPFHQKPLLIATTLIPHLPLRADNQYTIHWIDSAKTYDYIVW